METVGQASQPPSPDQRTTRKYKAAKALHGVACRPPSTFSVHLTALTDVIAWGHPRMQLEPQARDAHRLFAPIAAPYITCWKGFRPMLHKPAGSSQKPASSSYGASLRADKGGVGVLSEGP